MEQPDFRMKHRRHVASMTNMNLNINNINSLASQRPKSKQRVLKISPALKSNIHSSINSPQDKIGAFNYKLEFLKLKENQLVQPQEPVIIQENQFLKSTVKIHRKQFQIKKFGPSHKKSESQATLLHLYQPAMNRRQSTHTEVNDKNKEIIKIKQRIKYLYIIGIGGFGKVWKILSEQDQCAYAMKEMSKALQPILFYIQRRILAKKSCNSIFNERNLLIGLNNRYLIKILNIRSHIVNIHKCFQDQENIYLVMDYVSGGDLRFHIGKMKKFNEEETKFFIACILVGLEYLHQNHIIHRDIKPENLLLDEDGYVRISDLGIARKLRSDNQDDTSGTPGYMAPEVICRQNHSYTADYFALGVIGYEFMLGRRPYYGRSRGEIREQMLSFQAQVRKEELPVDWSEEALDFINRLLNRNPLNRLGHNGISEVKNHSWLRSFCWKKLLTRQLEAPFIPKVVRYILMKINQKQTDNFDTRQIAFEDAENCLIIKQNQHLLHQMGDQFKGYEYERVEQ